jgi:hypothetical protein
MQRILVEKLWKLDTWTVKYTNYLREKDCKEANWDKTAHNIDKRLAFVSTVFGYYECLNIQEQHRI